MVFSKCRQPLETLVTPAGFEPATLKLEDSRFSLIRSIPPFSCFGFIALFHRLLSLLPIGFTCCYNETVRDNNRHVMVARWLHGVRYATMESQESCSSVKAASSPTRVKA